ncbi:hypothetical protein FNF29_07496 [Cafeteria roenbergensis]|uniref:MYST-type HAT domain-containing protein n=1 Tax=Cafeteria roenbergensis TaxID=33653 RepID=A0A5A8C366_CAFRO|nr:hypothetical protein FNF29_07496 [Cafeteria roenbergensis]|eukprot:KAA0147235.1 hypothetical protein FNF29_07496 [Cafeteria roenbergensis]
MSGVPLTTLEGRPIRKGDVVVCRWDDDAEHTGEVLETAAGAGAADGLVYLHYPALNRRMDDWVERRQVLRHAAPEQLADLAAERRAALQRQTRRSSRSREAVEGQTLLSLPGVDPSVALAAEEEHAAVTRVKNVSAITLGAWRMRCWYFSPFPEGFSRLRLLHMHPMSLRYFESETALRRHHSKEGALWSVFEVDGARHRLWCRCLCLLAKLFLDHKTLYFDVDPFLFYVLCEVDDRGSHHIVGYFSKEKHSPEGNNLACILTLPPYQGRGYAKLLIALSFAMSRAQRTRGSPEKPLSDLGRLSYTGYWSWAALRALAGLAGISDAQVEAAAPAASAAAAASAPGPRHSEQPPLADGAKTHRRASLHHSAAAAAATPRKAAALTTSASTAASSDAAAAAAAAAIMTPSFNRLAAEAMVLPPSADNVSVDRDGPSGGRALLWGRARSDAAGAGTAGSAGDTDGDDLESGSGSDADADSVLTATADGAASYVEGEEEDCGDDDDDDDGDDDFDDGDDDGDDEAGGFAGRGEADPAAAGGVIPAPLFGRAIAPALRERTQSPTVLQSQAAAAAAASLVASPEVASAVARSGLDADGSAIAQYVSAVTGVALADTISTLESLGAIRYRAGIYTTTITPERILAALATKWPRAALAATGRISAMS